MPVGKTRFFGTKELSSDGYAKDFKKINDEVLTHLAATPGVDLRVTLEIEVTTDDGFDEVGLSAQVVRRMLTDAERVIDYHAEYEAARGPEHRAWAARLAAEELRWRWLSQLDPPDAAELVAVEWEPLPAFVKN